MALLDDARAAVHRLEGALTRLQRGDYAVCERCGGPIAAGRLDARPGVTTCIDCARRGP